jgi:hypothetical protein
MSGTKYLSVIHVQTKKRVTAFQFEYDATWIGRDKEEIIATPLYCNLNEIIKMVFVKTYKKESGKKVTGYFRAMPGQPNPKNEIAGESYGHKKAKENLYSGLSSGEITINGEPLDLKLVKNIFLEYRTSKEEFIIPDLIVLFNDVHPKYGLGIFFEIQLSEQTEERTIERDYRRVIEGFSGTWLWNYNFDNEWKLSSNDIEIESHKKLLFDLESIKENNFIKKINRYGEIIDNKIIGFKEEINLYCLNEINNCNKSSLFLKSQVDNAIDVCNDNLLSINESSNKIINEKINPAIRKCITKINNIKINLDDSYKRWSKLNIEDIGKDIEEKLYKIYEEKLERFYREISDVSKNTKLDLENDSNKIINNIKNIDIKKLITIKKCPKCGKRMKIGEAMNGYNWYCEDSPYCEGIILEAKL